MREINKFMRIQLDSSEWAKSENTWIRNLACAESLRGSGPSEIGDKTGFSISGHHRWLGLKFYFVVFVLLTLAVKRKIKSICPAKFQPVTFT